MRARIFSGVVTVALTQISGLPHAYAAGVDATVLDAGGCVREASGAECKAASAGAIVSQQAGFVAGRGGNRLRLADGSEVALAPDTEVVLLPTSKLDLGTRGGLRGQVLQIVQGRCEVVVGGPKGSTAVMLRGGGRLAAIAKSGTIVVRAARDSLAVANVAGLALAASGNDWSDVPAGKVRVISKVDPKGTLRDLAAAPLTAQSRNVALAVGGAVDSPVEAAWLASPGAAEYELVVRRDGGAEVDRRRVPAGATTIALPGLDVGAFAFSVRAVDADGITSAWSAPADLFVAGLALPEGSFRAPSGAIQLAPGQKVRLLPFDGLEIGMGLAWLPTVPAEIGLSGTRAETLHVRRKGGTVEQAIRLEPRTTIARVEMSPKNPRWPGPPVQIRVTLADRSGGPPPAGIKLVSRVVLDVTPLEVAWSERDGAMTATIEPRDTARPHVIHVDVVDQFGVALGEGFLEVAPDVVAKPER